MLALATTPWAVLALAAVVTVRRNGVFVIHAPPALSCPRPPLFPCPLHRRDAARHTGRGSQDFAPFFRV